MIDRVREIAAFSAKAPPMQRAACGFIVRFPKGSMPIAVHAASVL